MKKIGPPPGFMDELIKAQAKVERDARETKGDEEPGETPLDSGSDPRDDKDGNTGKDRN